MIADHITSAEQVLRKYSYELAYSFKEIPVEFRSSEVCQAAVNKRGENLKYVPMELRTFELCLCAVKQNDEALKYVPGKNGQRR
jgi:hypothetical protein